MASRPDLQSCSGGRREARSQATRDDRASDNQRDPGNNQRDPDALSEPVRLQEFAPAKVNLYLQVTGRRPDGYHLLDSLAVFAAVGDELTASTAPEVSLAIEGPFASRLATEPDNLVLRAARALAREGQGARIILRKNLPVASGLGGGSADAAATLRLLARAWEVENGLPEIAAQLGADVPVCLASRPARMRGVGERLDLAPSLPACGMVLVNPRIPLPTAQVFQARWGAFSACAELPSGWRDAASMALDLGRLRNDLEPAAVSLCPEIGEVLKAIASLPGCLLARMSGSGATCFGLFEDAQHARQAIRLLARPKWWSWGGGLYGRLIS